MCQGREARSGRLHAGCSSERYDNIRREVYNISLACMKQARGDLIRHSQLSKGSNNQGKAGMTDRMTNWLRHFVIISISEK